MATATHHGVDRKARGRDATTPSHIPLAGWRDVLIRTWRESSTDNVNLIAAGVAFYFFLAFVPLLAALVMTYGLIAEPETVVRHIQALTRLVPPDAARLIGEQLMSVTQAAQGQKGVGLLIALLLALYGAMRGASSIITALNIVYDEEEKRGFIRTTLLALAMTIGFVLVGMIGILAVSVMGFVERLATALSPMVASLAQVASWILAALLASTVIAAIYRYGPDRDRPRWRWLTPGSVVATLVWLAMTVLFGVYVQNFGNYNATYGSLGAVVVLLMWLYLSAYVLLMGAELNAEMEHQTAQDSTEGPAQPQGTRGAYVADTVGPTP